MPLRYMVCIRLRCLYSHSIASGDEILELTKLTLSQNTIILEYSKLKDFADDNFKFDENGGKFSKTVENEQFLLFPQCFLLNQIIVSSFVHIFDIISLFAAEFEGP